jgi:hypothetical protein
MPLITKTFDYSGQFQIAELPSGTTTITMHLWGGGGGPGGMDSQGSIAGGAAGHYVTVTDLDVSAYAGNKLIGVAVGGGAEAGGSGGETDGGRNGKSLTGYSGGQGGSSGPIGSSGSGGGGGGATTVTLFENGQAADTIKLAIAGGGGGGGGTGYSSRGGVGINSNSATSNTPGTLGENGAGHSGDGGGGGAGGGGADGGKGGSGATGDAGGFGGNSGSNLVPSGGSENNGSGIDPAGTGSAHYSSGIAKGGSGSAAGGAGRAVLIFNVPSDSKVKVSGTYKSFDEIYVKVAGVWKHINSGFVKVGGVWKSIFSSDILFNGNSAQFGNAIGGATSGTEGSGGIPTIANIPPQSGGGQGDGEGRGFIAPKKSVPQRHNPHTVSGYSNATVATSKYGAPIGGGTSCFVAGTKISMADGTLKNIEDVVVGEEVRGHNGNNTVVKLDWVLLGDRKLYTFNDSEHYFFTSEHPFMTTEGWKSVKPEKTKERDGVELYEEIKGALEVGDKIITGDGLFEITKIKSKEINEPELPLYNFHISNDKSYIADNYVVHNKCFLAGTPITMADGTIKPVEQVDLGDEVAVGGIVFGTGKFLTSDLHDYKGIKVSGSHMVKEDGAWMRVRDTKHGKPLGDDEVKVYVFGTENRRILIKDTLFTDYFDGFEQQGLETLGENYFGQWREHAQNSIGLVDKQIVDFTGK